MANGSNLILALDKMPLGTSLKLVEKVGQYFAMVKVNDLADEVGAPLVPQLLNAGAKDVWTDFKFLDTKDTLKARSKRWLAAGARALSVHGSAGSGHVKAVVETGALAIGITVLTDIDKNECQEIYGLGQTPPIVVPRLACVIAKGGAQHVVCSGLEVGLILSNPQTSHLLPVVPGTRSLGKSMHDQKRVTTPKQAFDAGAKFLVIGRQVTEAPDPVAAVNELLEEIA